MDSMDGVKVVVDFPACGWQKSVSAASVLTTEEEVAERPKLQSRVYVDVLLDPVCAAV